MKSGAGQPDLLEALEEQLSDALRTVALLKKMGRGERGPDEGNALLTRKRVFLMAVNGKAKRASECDIRRINPAHYALYLDLVSRQLGCHLFGEKLRLQSVQEAGVAGVADILSVMMEHPLLNFGNANIGYYLRHRKGMTPDAFRKAMAKIRRALQHGARDGPFLLHFGRSDFSVSESGHAWRISKEKGDLCVVRFFRWPRRFRRKRR